jgi:hypothetical protein
LRSPFRNTANNTCKLNSVIITKVCFRGLSVLCSKKAVLALLRDQALEPRCRLISTETGAKFSYYEQLHAIRIVTTSLFFWHVREQAQTK